MSKRLDRQDELRELAIANVVDQTDGISDRVLDNLDDEFGTSKAVGNASVTELKAIDGIGPVLARKVARKTTSARLHPEIHLGEQKKRKVVRR